MAIFLWTAKPMSWGVNHWVFYTHYAFKKLVLVWILESPWWITTLCFFPVKICLIDGSKKTYNPWSLSIVVELLADSWMVWICNVNYARYWFIVISWISLINSESLHVLSQINLTQTLCSDGVTDSFLYLQKLLGEDMCVEQETGFLNALDDIVKRERQLLVVLKSSDTALILTLTWCSPQQPRLRTWWPIRISSLPCWRCTSACVSLNIHIVSKFLKFHVVFSLFIFLDYPKIFISVLILNASTYFHQIPR